MKTQKGSSVIIILVCVLILLIGLYLFGLSFKKTEPTVYVNKEVAETSFQSNIEIKEAMASFATVVKNRKGNASDGLFCAGGFISNTEPGLRQIADTIIKNRIVNNLPLQYARTQDEAGITCLGSAEEWVLFVALNPLSSDDKKNYWCVDSRGVSGNFGFNSETNQCLNVESL